MRNILEWKLRRACNTLLLGGQWENLVMSNCCWKIHRTNAIVSHIISQFSCFSHFFFAWLKFSTECENYSWFLFQLQLVNHVFEAGLYWGNVCLLFNELMWSFCIRHYDSEPCPPCWRSLGLPCCYSFSGLILRVIVQEISPEVSEGFGLLLLYGITSYGPCVKKLGTEKKEKSLTMPRYQCNR